ncbi:MAG: bacillithiol biosynthesis cysteine-adding enzyme BshC [Melioribacteraceae bacterium]
MHINFSNIPAHQNLFLDYIEEFENVARFYGKNFRDVDQFLPHFNELASKDRPHRALLAEIIQTQYHNQKISKATLHNIENLASPKTIAIVTGQQLGLFGGPMYTFYKTITAIKLCEYLSEQYSEFNFVPVFWLEGDDHDYDEARAFSVLSNDNSFLSIQYDDGLGEEINRGSIGGLKFNENLNAVFENLSSTLRETEFKASLIDLLKSIYQPGKTFLESFRELMINLFDEYGLVVFNPIDNAAKRLLIPVFKKAIAEYADQSTALVERSAELEEIYHAQVKVKAINMFYVDENERLLIEPTDSGDLRLKGKRKKFSFEDMLNQIEFNPEKFSPNVLLRPICQDFLFPTGFYIGGPGEISYFAQVNPLYEIYDIEEPFIYPRSSATIVEQGVNQVLQKHGFSYTDIFSDEKELIQKIVDASSEVNLEGLFEKSNEEIRKQFLEISQKLSTIDKTLGDLSEKSRQKIEQTLDYLKNKASDAEKRKYDTSIRQLTKVRNVLFPNGSLQEREINFLYFVNKYGIDFLKWIFNELEINRFDHQILEL